MRFLRGLLDGLSGVERMTVEAEMFDESTGLAVEHGVADLVVWPSGFRVTRFRSAARPDEDWPLLPNHSFRLELPIEMRPRTEVEAGGEVDDDA